MTGATCGNNLHPSGWQHETTPPATRWQWGKRLSQWLNRERHDCRCDAGSGGEDDDARVGLEVVDRQQVLGTCSPELPVNLKAALRELFRPEPIPDEQSFDEQVQARTAWVRRTRHPAGCDGTDNCGCVS